MDKPLLPLPHSTWVDLYRWLTGRYQRFRITGNSMLPLLIPGQEVLIDLQAYETRSPQTNELVMADHPQQPGLRIVKRIEFVASDGRYYLKGENRSASNDSRQFGLVTPTQIRGQVVCLLP